MTKDKVGNTLHKSLVLGCKPSGHRPTPGSHAVCAAGGPGLEVPSFDLKPSKSSKSKATSQDRSQQRPPLNPHEAPALAGGPTRAGLSSLEPGFCGATKGKKIRRCGLALAGGAAGRSRPRGAAPPGSLTRAACAAAGYSTPGHAAPTWRHRLSELSQQAATTASSQETPRVQKLPTGWPDG